MYHYRGVRRNFIPAVVPVLFASGALGLFALLWRRRSAPRSHTRMTTSTPPSAVVADEPQVKGVDQQPVSDGAGEIYHRRYEVDLENSERPATEIVRLMKRHLAELTPSILAHFEKSNGSEDALRVGDEYEITMLGPWNGAVRVAESTPTSFTFVTLEGHPEAGRITFSAAGGEGAPMRAQIESWARARDAAVATAYGTLGVGKQIQTEAWITFLQRLCTLAGVDGTPKVRVSDEVIPAKALDDVGTVIPHG